MDIYLDYFDWAHVRAPFSLPPQKWWFLFDQINLYFFICGGKSIIIAVDIIMLYNFHFAKTYLHHHLFWAGFPSARQILGTLL